MSALHQTRRMVPRLLMAAVSLTAVAALVTPVRPAGLKNAELKNQAFELQYGPTGITSLRRAHDVADTEYVGPNGAWALVNSGTAGSGYGAWFPSANNDGAAGGGFMPEAIGRAWIGKEMRRGAWYYSAEEDVGYCAAIRTHATIVAHDPIFGEIAYGGVLTRSRGVDSVIPRDGLRVRFHVVRGDQRLHLELDHDGFAKEQPIAIADDLSRIEFTVENRTGGAHTTGLSIEGLPAGGYDVVVSGRKAAAASVAEFSWCPCQ